MKAVKEWIVPRDRQELRSFLGLRRYYRGFVPRFSTIARPLNKLMEAALVYDWTNDYHKAFEKLKTEHSNSSVLSYPYPDTSNFGIGNVLSQM